MASSSPAPMMFLSFLCSLMNDYSIMLEEAPVITKAITSATVYTIGDIIAQKSEGSKRIDWRRTLRSLVAGGLGHGPMSHYWYIYSESLFEELHWTSWWTVFLKVLLDQSTWGPFWNNTYIVLLGIMKSESPLRIVRDIRRTTLPLIMSGLKVWFPAHCITYGVIHVEYRLLWVDVCEILWVTILATQAAGKAKVKKANEPTMMVKSKASTLSLTPSTDDTEAASTSSQQSNPNSPHEHQFLDPFEPVPESSKGRGELHQTNMHRSTAKGRRSRHYSTSGETIEAPKLVHVDIPDIKVHSS